MLHKHENVTNILKMKHKKYSRDRTNGNLCPLGRLFYSQTKNDTNIDNKPKMNVFWKYLDHSQNNCEVLIQWAFVILGTTPPYTTSKFNHLRKSLESNQCIDGNRRNHKNRHPHHTLHKPEGEADPYLRFGYGPLTILNLTWRQVSGSMNDDPINIIYTSQKSSKEGFNK